MLTGIAAICLAVAMIGVSYGATAVTSGLPVWLPMLLSIAVVAGGSEFVFIGIVTAGGSLIAAVLAGLLVNARHLPYGLSVPDVVGSGWRRLIGTQIMNDESVALALAQPDRDRRRAAYWLCGLGVLAAWPLGAALGAVLGSVVPNPNAFGLDAVFPAVLITLVLPSLREPLTRTAALAGAAVAAITTPFLGAGLPVLLALAAVLIVARRAGNDELPTAAPNSTPEGGAVVTSAAAAAAASNSAEPKETASAATFPAATLPAATLPVATLPVATGSGGASVIGTAATLATATSSSVSSGTGTTATLSSATSSSRNSATSTTATLSIRTSSSETSATANTAVSTSTAPSATIAGEGGVARSFAAASAASVAGTTSPSGFHAAGGVWSS